MSQTFGPTKISQRWPMVRRYCSGALGHPELFRLHLRRKTAITRAGMLAGQGLQAMAALRTNSTSRYFWERDPDFRWRWWLQDQAYAWWNAPDAGRRELDCWAAAVPMGALTWWLSVHHQPWRLITSSLTGFLLGLAGVQMRDRVARGRKR